MSLSRLRHDLAQLSAEAQRVTVTRQSGLSAQAQSAVVSQLSPRNLRALLRFTKKSYQQFQGCVLYHPDSILTTALLTALYVSAAR